MSDLGVGGVNFVALVVLVSSISSPMWQNCGLVAFKGL